MSDTLPSGRGAVNTPFFYLLLVTVPVSFDDFAAVATKRPHRVGGTVAAEIYKPRLFFGFPLSRHAAQKESVAVSVACDLVECRPHAQHIGLSPGACQHPSALFFILLSKIWLCLGTQPKIITRPQPWFARLAHVLLSLIFFIHPTLILSICQAP